MTTTTNSSTSNVVSANPTADNTNKPRPDTRSRSKRKLFTKVVECQDATEHLLRQMWSLRLNFLTLRNITEEEDYQRFKGYCTLPNTYLFTFRDEEQNLQAYFTFALNPVQQDKHKALLIHSKYYYVNTGFRGHPKITSAAWPMMPKFLWRYGLRRIYFIAFTFPPSFISLSRTFGKVLTIQGDIAEDWEKIMLENYVADFNGDDWDSEKKVIRNQSVPIGEDKAPSKGVNALRESYIQMNPEWQSGASLPIMMRFDWETIKNILATSLRRNKRRR